MKRCPQCDFIYEDDQRLCDMDGILLVFDGRKLPKLNALEPNSGVSPRQWRSRTVPVIAGLILATVLAFVYYVSTQQNLRRPEPATRVSAANQSQTTTPVPSTSADSNQSHAPVPTASANTATEKPATSVKREESAEKAKVPAPGKVAPRTSPTPETKKQKTKPKRPAANAVGPAAVSPNKKDSKIGSLLKKTGRFFKKAF
jgi:hypothetical protein